LLNKRPDSDPIVLEDIDPTSDWVVESCPPEFDRETSLDFDLDMEATMLNVDPLVADQSQAIQLQPLQVQALPLVSHDGDAYLVYLILKVVRARV